MRETEQSIEDLRALYRSLGMREETLERAIQFGAIKPPEEMVAQQSLAKMSKGFLKNHRVSIQPVFRSRSSNRTR